MKEGTFFHKLFVGKLFGTHIFPRVPSDFFQIFQYILVSLVVIHLTFMSEMHIHVACCTGALTPRFPVDNDFSTKNHSEPVQDPQRVVEVASRKHMKVDNNAYFSMDHIVTSWLEVVFLVYSITKTFSLRHVRRP